MGEAAYISNLTHEEYLLMRFVGPTWEADWCTRCGAFGRSLSADGMCAECVRLEQENEGGTEWAVMKMIEGAVRAAIDCGVRASMIRRAVEEALDPDARRGEML